MFYRVRQFIKAVTGKVTSEEIAFVKRYLSHEECQLFFRLKPYEQRHCIDVAYQIMKVLDEDKEMVRLGLLHDIGKIQYPLNPIEKSMIVILDCISHGKIKKYATLKMVKCYYLHPQIGYELLKQIGTYEEEFLEIIRKHHESHAGDSKLILLQKADNLS